MELEGCREKIISQDYWDFIIPGYRRDQEILSSPERFCVQEAGLGYRIVSVDGRTAGDLTFENYGYPSIPQCYGLLDMDALNETGISTVQNYPALNLDGRGIMIGLVDTGIDYTNEIFQNLDGTTRIVGIWDQTIQTGRPPEGFFYGTEYTQRQINEALRSEEPEEVVPSRDENSHGTFLASIAAGSPVNEERFSGAAPAAAIGVVKLKEAKDYLKEFYAIKPEAVCYQENDIMQGLNYLNRLAEEKGLPLVLCIALGTTFGGHNGGSLLSRILREYANTIDRCVVIGGGNEAAYRHHYFGRLDSAGSVREAEIRVEDGVEGFAAEVWTTLPNIVTAYLVSPSGEKSPVISLRQGSMYRLNFPFDGTQVDVEYRLLIENEDSQLIFFRFQNPAGGIWKIGVEAIQISEGEFHIWLPLQDFLSGEVYFLEADPNTTLTEPGSTEEAITVAFYNGEDKGVDIHSGRGYTRGGLIKPDFAVPGVDITGLGPKGRFVKRTGSSAAVGITAGASALIMQWLGEQPMTMGITTSAVAGIIILGTEQDNFLEYPNREWGYGRMNVYQSLDRLRRL